jgi:hypothetical protein
MQELFIEIRNGLPFEHPYLKENLMDFHGGIIPENFEPFNRIVERPDLLDLFVKHETTYEKVDGVWSDVHNIVDMTEEEIQNEIDNFQKEFLKDITHLKSDAQIILSESNDTNVITIFQDYINRLNNVKKDDSIVRQFGYLLVPSKPIQDEQGIWLAPLDILGHWKKEARHI